MAGANSRWLGPKKDSLQARRVSKESKQSVEDGRWIKMPTAKGYVWRFETDQVTERAWVDRRREGEGWKNGAKVYRKAA